MHSLIYAFILDGTGSGREIGWSEIKKWSPAQGTLWVHLDYSAETSRKWLQQESGLDEIAASALLTEETRPRTTVINDAVLMALRGVNLNPESDPEDMVSLRLWADQHRVVTTRKRALLSVSDIARSLQNNSGPLNSADFIVDLTDRLTARMSGTIEGIDDNLAIVEEEIIESSRLELRQKLTTIRREAIMLRRYLAPQREALTRIHTEKISWLGETDRIRLRETSDKLIRYVEDLDSIRDRASVTQEELMNRFSEQMNNRMYVLSIVAAIFLPLGFLTGLLGINVGGIPGADNPWAFLIFIGILIMISTGQILLFKKKKWF